MDWLASAIGLFFICAAVFTGALCTVAKIMIYVQDRKSEKELARHHRRENTRLSILALEHEEGIVDVGFHLNIENCPDCKAQRAKWLQEACEHPREHETHRREMSMHHWQTGADLYTCGICGRVKRVDVRAELEAKRREMRKARQREARGFEWE